MRMLLLATLALITAAPLLAKIEYTPVYRVVAKPAAELTDKSIEALFAAVKDIERTSVATENDKFVVIVYPIQGKKLREAAIKKLLKDSAELLEFEEREADTNGVLKPRQITGKDLAKLSWEELHVEGRTWLVQITADSGMQTKSISYERWSVTKTSDEGVTVRVATLSETGRELRAEDRTIKHEKLTDAKPEQLETTYGKITCDKTADVTSTPNPVDPNTKVQLTVTKWHTKSGLVLREEALENYVGESGGVKAMVKGKTTIREVVELSE